MAQVTPPFITNECYEAEILRLAQSGTICEEGVKTFEGLRVTQTLAGADGSIEVSAGGAWIQAAPGGTVEDQGGMYYAHSTEVEVRDVPLNSSGVSRTDRVWAKVCDFGYAAVVSEFEVVYEDDNATGIPPADGCTYYLLATLVVPNGGGTGGTNITGQPSDYGDTDGQITDSREQYTSCGGTGGAPREIVLFSVDGIFEKADYPWLKSVKVRLVGGGAGGGASAGSSDVSESSAGSGGSAGGYAEDVFTAEELPDTVTVTIGQGGSGSGSSAAPGAAGTATQFGALVEAGGGVGGTSSGAASAVPVIVTGSTGGIGTVGAVKLRGGSSGGGQRLAFGTEAIGAGGRGGDSQLGGGAAQPPSNGNGTNATGHGGGGSGAGTNGNQAAHTGGDGKDGLVIVELYG